MTGTWTSEATALRKFREFIGSHGSMNGVVITLWEETAQGRKETRSWTNQNGESVAR
ncbi:hypothetical protein [Streptomyces sp. NEAU-H3]|uniref:hypothetical protein n=1 Tax=Streptomyces sp. NEAU-H3 TaxID=2720636 RepID=UPI001ADB46BD|nr:hypothetical protein [Streptomyces sp. NEAU-H3]